MGRSLGAAAGAAAAAGLAFRVAAFFLAGLFAFFAGAFFALFFALFFAFLGAAFFFPFLGLAAFFAFFFFLAAMSFTPWFFGMKKKSYASSRQCASVCFVPDAFCFVTVAGASHPCFITPSSVSVGRWSRDGSGRRLFRS
jgi:hypothetical protein